MALVSGLLEGCTLLRQDLRETHTGGLEWREVWRHRAGGILIEKIIQVPLLTPSTPLTTTHTTE